MRKLFILAIALSINIVAFGQRAVHTVPEEISSYNNCDFSFVHGNPYARSTAVGDTFVLSNIPATDSLVIYSAGISDSGYLTGTDIWNDIGFAESYTISGEDSSLVVIGVVALFHGTVTASSSQTITFDVWDETPYVLRTTYEYVGFPNDCLDSLTVPATQLGIGVGTATDTLKTFLFPNITDTVGGGSDVDFVGSSFFVGYTITYNFGLLTGDTLGLACSENGTRPAIPPVYTIDTFFDTVINVGGGDSSISVIDTFVNVQNATEFSDYSWHDNYTDNDSLFNDLAIYPIVVITTGPTSVKGVTRKDLTFFGNYPNPASDYTNIKFSLLQNADVTIQIMGMNGGVISTINNANLSMGEHIIPVNTSSMPSGNYLYFIHTSGGDGIASKMTVIH